MSQPLSTDGCPGRENLIGTTSDASFVPVLASVVARTFMLLDSAGGFMPEGFEASERFHRLLAFSQSFAPAIFKAELFRVFKGDEK
jgi:hypothetical protein